MKVRHSRKDGWELWEKITFFLWNNIYRRFGLSQKQAPKGTQREYELVRYDHALDEASHGQNAETQENTRNGCSGNVCEPARRLVEEAKPCRKYRAESNLNSQRIRVLKSTK